MLVMKDLILNCLVQGMENLALAISYWEDAVMKLSYLDDQQGVLAIPVSEHD